MLPDPSTIAERYWIPKGSNVELTDGFFHSEIGDSNAVQQRVNYVHSLNIDVACMVLLGPPGIGKSTEFLRAIRAAREHGSDAEFVSLSGIYTSDALETILVDAAVTGGERPVFVFLDALDESPVTVPVIQQWLIGAVQTARKLIDQSNSKLLIRISARTADWSDQFENQLQEIWGRDSVQVFELPPLTRDQALAFVNSQSSRALEFFNAVEADSSGAFASRPVTLRMLLNSFLAQGTFSGDKVAIYRRGILALLEESNRARRARGANGELDTEARFAIAGRIAAASALSTKSVIWDGLYSDPIPSHTIPISEIAGGIEEYLGDRIVASLKHIRETLRTGLFRPIADNTFEWAHKTFAEFLAAYYIKSHGASTDKIFSLVRSGLPGNDRVVPQLREVAAWLSALDRQILEGLVVTEPGLLLSSDVALVSNDDRKELVGQLIRKLDDREMYDRSEWRSYYKRLDHPELAVQLAPIIRDRSKNVILRRTVIDIAEACLRSDLLPVLKAIAFDETENDHIRAQATHALTEIVPWNQRRELIPLVIDPGLDPDDEIKGCALTGLWPQCLTTQELFGVLTKRKNESLIGSYGYFLFTLQIPALDSEGALAALEWLEGEAIRDDTRGSFDKLIPAVLTRIWESATDGEVVRRFARFILDEASVHSRLRHEREMKAFEAVYVSSPPERRRRLILSVFEAAPKEWKQARLLAFIPWPMVIRDDIRWLVDELLNKSGPWNDQWLIDLIIGLVDWGHFREIEFVWEASEKHEGLKQALDAISVVALDSDLAKWRREECKRSETLAARAGRPSLKETILELLDKSEGAEPEAFWRLNLALLEDESERVDEFTGVLVPSPGWEVLDQSEKQRVIAAALRYLKAFRLAEGYLEPNTHHRPAAAGYRALRLLMTEDASSYRELGEEIWSAWALPIVSFSSNDGNSEQELRRTIAKDCYLRVPAAFLSAVSIYLRTNKSLDHILYLVRGWTANPVMEFLWKAIEDSGISDREYEQAVEELIKSGFGPAIERAYDVLKQILPDTTSDIDERSLSMAAAIVFSQPRTAWQAFGQIVEARPAIGQSLITRLAAKRRDTHRPREASTTPAQQAQLYVWIESLFTRPPDTTGARFLRPVDEVWDLHEALLRDLIGRGSSESVAAVNWIADQLPHVEWLRWSLDDARENQRRVEWEPLSPRSAIEHIRGHGIEAPVLSDKEKIVQEAVENFTAGEPENKIDLHGHVPEAVPVPAPNIKEASTTARKLTFLVVNDEWGSGHGGISTFSRQLCIALASHGHKVFCFIPNARQDEIASADRLGVTIVVAGQYPGASSSQMLARGPLNHAQIHPDVVIGHDHITGAQALALAREEYHCPYLHFVHSSPEEIEVFKDTYERRAKGIVNYEKGNEKGETQRELCILSDIVLAVGPKLERHIRTSLLGRVNGPSIVKVLPGLNGELLDFHRPLGYQLELRCLLSGRLDETLIKGTDLFVRIAGEFQKRSIGPQLKGTKFIMRGFEKSTMSEQVATLRMRCDVKPNNIQARPFIADEAELLQELQSASSFLMPSKTEGFGLTGLDAIAAGIPLIASAESGLGELLLLFAPTLPGNLKHIARDCVLDVEPDGDEVLESWVSKLIERLSDSSRAFAEADDLRKILVSKLSWEDAAETVTQAALRSMHK